MTKTEASNYIKGRLKEKSFQETVIDHNWDGYLHGTELRAAFLTLTGLPSYIEVADKYEGYTVQEFMELIGEIKCRLVNFNGAQATGDITMTEIHVTLMGQVKALTTYQLAELLDYEIVAEDLTQKNEVLG